MRTSLPFKSWCISSVLVSVATAVLVCARWAGSTADAAQSPASPANLSGRVEFRGSPRAPSYRNDFYSYQPPSTTGHRPDPLRAIVYLEGDGLQPTPDPPAAVIDQRDEQFVPHILAVQRGTRVDFRNSDAIYHNVFSFSKTKRFDLGRYPQGRSRSVVFDRLGVVRVFCEIHSHMSAFVLVLPHSYFATTDASGNYRIADIPPGRYRAVAWGDPFQPDRRDAQLRSGASSRIDFILEQGR